MSRDLEFIYEIGCLRFIQRTWRQFLNPDFANVAEHTLRVAFISMILAKREEADIEKTLKIALVHDLTESRTGDTNYLTRQYNEQKDGLAISDILKGTSLEEFKGLWQEYKRRESKEAKIVKDADLIDVDLELHEQQSKGNKMKDCWQRHRKLVAENLYTKAARELWEEIQKSNPLDWHLNSRNRFNDGDWKS